MDSTQYFLSISWKTICIILSMFVKTLKEFLNQYLCMKSIDMKLHKLFQVAVCFEIVFQIPLFINFKIFLRSNHHDNAERNLMFIVNLAIQNSFYHLKFATKSSLCIHPDSSDQPWAIPEVRCTPPKEDMGIPKILTTFWIGKSQKTNTFLVARVKKTWEFPKYSIILVQNFFKYFWHKKIGNSHFFKTIFRIHIF